MKKTLFITNIPAPYKIDFFNCLGKMVDLTVLFEATGASDQGIKFNYNLDEIESFKAVFLKDGDIAENKIDFKVIGFVKDNYFDEIILSSYSYLTEMIVLLYLKLHRTPYYLSSDGGIVKRNEPSIKKQIKRFLVRGAKGYFSPSTSSDEYLIYYGAKCKQIYRYPFTSTMEKEINNNLESEWEKQRLRNKYNLKEKFIVLGVGQFIHRKGWDILIKASKYLKDDVGVYIIGGKEKKEYTDMIRKYSISNIHFLDFMNKSELSDFYSMADIFVLPTREDIWGLVINEAMAHGLPVITTDKCVAGIELVSDGENGHIISVDDTDSDYTLAKYLNSLISSTEKIGEYSRKSREIIKNFTVEEMANSYSKVLNMECYE